tara:strand:- start:1 stop:438 length:438 start_codon:yes stop_codon:yes gene_type:complete
MNIQSNLKNVQNILDRFPKDEVQLASHKVELTAIQDIKERVDDIMLDIQDANGYTKDLVNESIKVSKAKDELQSSIDDSSDSLKNVNIQKSKVKQLKDNISSLAKDLGVSLKDIKGVSNLDTALGKLESEAKFLRAAIKTAKQEL